MIFVRLPFSILILLPYSIITFVVSLFSKKFSLSCGYITIVIKCKRKSKKLVQFYCKFLEYSIDEIVIMLMKPFDIRNIVPSIIPIH